MINQDKAFKNRDGYKDSYSKDKWQNSRDNWQETAKKEKEWANSTSDKMAKKVGSDMKSLIAYLDMQAKFEMYSASNVLLILNQKPEATYLREYSKWKDDGYVVNDPRDKVIIIKRERVEKDNGEVSHYYNAKRLYDVSNTNAPALEVRETPSKETIIKTLLNGARVNVEIVNSLENNMQARYDFDRNVMQVCRGQDADSKIQDIVMELAKKEFNVNEPNISDEVRDSRKFKSTCVSYIFCKKFNIDFPKNKFAELPNYLSKDCKETKAELETIKDTYITITDNMYGAIDKERKEKNKAQVR